MANLMLGLAIMLVCLFVQALIVVLCIRFYQRRNKPATASTFLGSLALISGVMLVLVLGNLVQVGIWAALFVQLGEFDDIRTAIYHSAVNFATLGYGDIVMSEERRILGPIQSINGVLMIGVSTAVMMAALQHSLMRDRN